MTVALPIPFGLDAEPELWIIVDSEGTPFECCRASDESDWVIAARSERDVLAAHATMPDHPDRVRRSGHAARTTETSLRASILSVPDHRVRGWVIFDFRGSEVCREVVV